jgi:hypothetical protein
MRRQLRCAPARSGLSSRSPPSALPSWFQTHPGERVLWAGRPQRGRWFYGSDLELSVFGAFALVFAWAFAGEATATDQGPAVFAAVAGAIGLYFTVGRLGSTASSDRPCGLCPDRPKARGRLAAAHTGQAGLLSVRPGIVVGAPPGRGREERRRHPVLPDAGHPDTSEPRLGHRARPGDARWRAHARRRRRPPSRQPTDRRGPTRCPSIRIEA